MHCVCVREGERAIQSLKGYNSQSWTRSSEIYEIFHMDGRNPTVQSIACSLPGSESVGSWDWEQSQYFNLGTSIWDMGSQAVS